MFELKRSIKSGTCSIWKVLVGNWGIASKMERLKAKKKDVKWLCSTFATNMLHPKSLLIRITVRNWENDAQWDGTVPHFLGKGWKVPCLPQFHFAPNPIISFCASIYWKSTSLFLRLFFLPFLGKYSNHESATVAGIYRGGRKGRRSLSSGERMFGK
jgi:hypothetical protein